MKLFKISTGLVIEAESGVLHLATASTVPPPPACPPVDFDLWCVDLVLAAPTSHQQRADAARAGSVAGPTGMTFMTSLSRSSITCACDTCLHLHLVPDAAFTTAAPTPAPAGAFAGGMLIPGCVNSADSWLAAQLPTITAAEFAGYPLLAPIGSQEVWCAGVTYKKSQEQV